MRHSEPYIQRSQPPGVVAAKLDFGRPKAIPFVVQPLTPTEQLKLEASLDTARQATSNTAGATAWLQGWALPIEKAMEEVLLPEAKATSS